MDRGAWQAAVYGWGHRVGHSLATEQQQSYSENTSSQSENTYIFISDRLDSSSCHFASLRAAGTSL